MKEGGAFHIRSCDFAIGSRRKDNAVLPIGIHYDGGCAGGCVVALDELSINVIGLEVVEEEIAEVVFAHAPQHGNTCTKSRRSDRLISTLAAGNDLQIFAADGFAGLRKARCADNQIGIEGTNDKDFRHG